MPDHSYFANLIWQIADRLRGPYRPPQYERVMLPMTVLRRFDCVLAGNKPDLPLLEVSINDGVGNPWFWPMSTLDIMVIDGFR